MRSSRKRTGKKPAGDKQKNSGILELDENNVLSLESFPRFDPKQGGSIRKISDYLKRLISRSFKHTRVSSVALPSMNRLCGFFGCSQGELLNVLLLLKGQGLDYKIYALDKPISFWRHTGQERRSLKTS